MYLLSGYLFRYFIIKFSDQLEGFTNGCDYIVAIASHTLVDSAVFDRNEINVVIKNDFSQLLRY